MTGPDDIEAALEDRPSDPGQRSAMARLTDWFNGLSNLLKAIVGVVVAATLLFGAVAGLAKAFSGGDEGGETSSSTGGSAGVETSTTQTTSVPTTSTAFTAVTFPSGSGQRETSLSGTPGEGAPGTEVALSGSGFLAGETVEVRFHTRDVARLNADGSGAFRVTVRVPADWRFTGQFHFVATGRSSIRSADFPFLVT